MTPWSDIEVESAVEPTRITSCRPGESCLSSDSTVALMVRALFLHGTMTLTLTVGGGLLWQVCELADQRPR